MEFTTVLFYVFSTILVLAAVKVITDRNPVNAALYLVLSFFSAAAIWMLLQAEFLSIVLVLVYVGAVMVLFLFVVMMLDIHVGRMREGFWGYFPLAATVGVLIVLQMSAVLLRGFWTVETPVPASSAVIGTTKELGKQIYTDYVYAFEIAAIVLLVAIVAAVALTLRRRKDSRYFNPSDAVKVQRNDRVRLVKIPAQESSSQRQAFNPQSAPAARTDGTK